MAHCCRHSPSPKPSSRRRWPGPGIFVSFQWWCYSALYSTLWRCIMRARAVTLLAAGLLLIGAGRLTADDKADKDQEAVQGTWTLETLNQDGKAAPAEDLKRITFVFKDNTYAISMEGKELETGTFKLDSSKKPKTVDFE